MIASIVAGDRDGKFIAAQPRHDRLAAAQPAPADDRAQLHGELPQKLVTHRMAVHVVDTLEMIDIEHHQSDMLIGRMAIEQFG